MTAAFDTGGPTWKWMAALLIGIVTALLSALAGNFFGSNAETAAQIMELRLKVQVLESDLNYLRRDMERLEP